MPPVQANPAHKTSTSVRLDISGNKGASKRADENATEVIKVYTDGSSHHRAVDAAATLIRRGKPMRTFKLHPK